MAYENERRASLKQRYPNMYRQAYGSDEMDTPAQDTRRIGNFFWDNPRETRADKPRGKTAMYFGGADTSARYRQGGARYAVGDRTGKTYLYGSDKAAEQDARAFHEGRKEAYIRTVQHHVSRDADRDMYQGPARLFRVDGGRPPVDTREV